MKSRIKHTLFQGVVTAVLTSAIMIPSISNATDEPVRIAFVTHGQAGDSYWNALKKGMEDAAKETGAKFPTRPPMPLTRLPCRA